jgi:Transglycosylase
MRSRALRLILGALVAGAAACAAFALLRPAVEAEARARIEGAARRAGLSATIGSVHLTPWLALELRDVVLEDDGRVRLMTRSASVAPRLSFRVPPGRAARVSHGRVIVELPAGVRLEVAPATWAVESSQILSVRRVAPGERLELDVRRGRTGYVEVHAHATSARLSGLVRILFHGCPIADPGTVDGDARVEQEPRGVVELAVRGRARGLAVATWASGGNVGCDGAMGAPTDAELEAEARLETKAGSLRADRLRLDAGGAEVQARLAVDGGLADPRVELEARVPRVDFARLLATAGLDRPAEDLGWASLTASVSGPLLDPAALHVDERLDFNPPARPLPSIERLKVPFDHRAESPDGGTTLVRVGPDSPDFVPLAEVPPLFVRTLLIGEDAGFYGHPGIDLKEIPVALASDLASGTFARGASTIPQQLAKNLFLSRARTVSRKLEELALALLLDSSLGKDRVLEIYLNVIEWGPRLYGLRPAARHYFGREPAELTPKQMAFLVALVPGPLKYQRSFAGGIPSPFLEGRMATLLAKLRSVGALSDEEYAQALAEPLDLRVPDSAGDRGTPVPSSS